MMDTAEQNDNKFSVFNQSSTATSFNKNPNPNNNFLNLYNYECQKSMALSSSSRTTTTVDDLIQFNDQETSSYGRVITQNRQWGSSTFVNLPTIVEQEDLNNNTMKMEPEISNFGGTWGETESPSKAQKTWDNFGTNNFDYQKKQPISKYWKTSESDETDYRNVGGLLPKSNNIWSNVTTHDHTPWPKDKNLFPNSDLHEVTQTQKLDSSVELIRSTKEYRILIGKGFNREDVETALRNSFLNFDIALDALMAGQNQSFMKSANNNISSFVNRMAVPPQQVQQQPLQQRRPVPTNIQQVAQPSVEQLKIIVQQIQLAVQAGYLNGQILNQPLAPQTLALMNQLLIQIRDIQKSEQYLARGGLNSYQLSINMEKTKQTIHNIQLDIAFQQDLYIKQVFNATNQILQRRPSPPRKPPSHGFCNQNGPRAVTNMWDKNVPGEFLRANGPGQSNGSVNPYSFKPQTSMYDEWQQNTSKLQKSSVTPQFTSIVETAPEFQPGIPWKGSSSVISSSSSSSFSTTQTQPKEAEAAAETPNNYLSLSSSTWSYNPDAGLGLPRNGSVNINTDGIKWSNEEFGQSRISPDVWGNNTNPADTNWAQ